MATTWYMIAGTPGASPSGEQSSTMPLGTSVSSSPLEAVLSDTDGSGSLTKSTNSDASTSEQSIYQGRFTSAQIAAGTYGSGTWNFQVYAYESNNAANMYVRLSVYIWRSGTGVVGYIYDATADLNGEINGGSIASVTGTFSGSNVTAADGDRLCVEVWFHGTQGKANAYAQQVGYDGGSYSSYVTAPADIPLYSGPAATPLTGVGTAAASGSAALSTGHPLTGVGTAAATGVATTLDVVTTHEITGVGSAAATGAADISVQTTHQLSGVGSDAVSGAGLLKLGLDRALSGSGNQAFSLEATATRERPFSAVGSAASAGAGALVVSTPRSLTGVGTAASSGAGAIRLTASLAGVGSNATSGAADLSVESASGTARALTGVGSNATSGAAALEVTLTVTGVGTAASSGAADITVTTTHQLTGAGTAATSGAGSLTVTTTHPLEGVGTVAASGSADLTVTATSEAEALEGVGTAATAGSADLAVLVTLTGVGTAATSGSAAFTEEAAAAEPARRAGRYGPVPQRKRHYRSVIRIRVLFFYTVEVEPHPAPIRSHARFGYEQRGDRTTAIRTPHVGSLTYRNGQRHTQIRTLCELRCGPPSHDRRRRDALLIAALRR